MLSLGCRCIDFPFLLAPMAGITDSPFRTLMKELGSGPVVSELVSSLGVLYNSRRTMEMLRLTDRERPVGVQLFGHDAESLGSAAEVVARLGPDFIDVNLGCPVPKVVRKGAGAAMMRDPLELERMLKAVRRRVALPLTVKMRSGWDAGEKNAPDCVRAASEAGVAWIVVHGRTKVQGYSGEADWEIIARCKEVSGVPIIGNGDIMDDPTALRRLAETGCDGVMIGRGVLANPWIFLQVRSLLAGEPPGPAGRDVAAVLRRHRQLLDELGSPARAAINLRKFAAWYSHGYPGSATFRRQIFQASTLDQVEKLALTFFERVRDFPDEERRLTAFLTAGEG
ncbi:MAG: tRNA dihydrouridine synthase DusB [Candidatus Riflebacteria bacterium]|nr:tRNA dihydrouridine synthase DusB [Candidatus Riflebacteria bacterium]